MKVKSKKIFAAMMALTLCVSFALGGCSKADAPSKGGANDASATTQKDEARVPLTLFMSNAGVPVPDGTDPNDNPFINIVEDYANVDLTLEIPPWNDFVTKFNLMLASSKLPDIVETYKFQEADAAGDAGAFIDLKEYYDNSPVVQKVVPPELFELAKSGSGKYYRIPTPNPGPGGHGIVARYDMIQKYNDGKWPESVDEWVDLMRRIKKADPEFIGISAHNGFFDYGGPIFYWYGVPVEWGQCGMRVIDGELKASFTLPEYRAAVELSRQLYAEGLIDPEFATNDQPKRIAAVNADRVLLGTDWSDQIPGLTASHRQAGASEDLVFLYAPNLKEYPAEVRDVKYTYGCKQQPIAQHGVYISTSCKDPDKAWKVIEGLASDAMYEAIFWGKEGSEYTMEGDKRIPNPEKLADPSRTWSINLAYLQGYSAGRETNLAKYRSVTGEEIQKLELESVKTITDNSDIAGVRLYDVLQARTEDEKNADKKRPEAFEFEKAATIQAVMGQISMEEFDARVKEFEKNYGFIFETYGKQVQERKDELIKMGCNEAGW